jgi:hypothetical protein
MTLSLKPQLFSFGLLLAICSQLAGCGAVYPEVATPMRSVPLGKSIEPAPPPNLLFIFFEKAIIPKQTRDGRKWDAVGGDAPDPFAKLLLNGEELIKTPIESNTLHPTWPGQVRANYQIPQGARLTVELWDSNPINNGPICTTSVDYIHDKAGITSELRCNSGARILLHVEAARPKRGLGMYYELQSQAVKVTRVLKQSPAARAGLAPGVEIRGIQGQRVDQLDADEIRSLINANGQTGVKLDVKLADGSEKQIDLKEAAMYPLVDEGVSFH